MKKYVLFFLTLCVLGFIYLIIPKESDDYFTSVDRKKFNKDDFVSIGEHSFRMNGKDFYPLVVNYMAALATDGNEYWPCPAFDYTHGLPAEKLVKENCLKELRADMQLIRQMGFNSMRIVGLSEVSIADDNNKLSSLQIRPYVDRENFTATDLSDSTYKKYFSALALLLREADEAGLKIILTVRTRPDILTTEIFLERITAYFKNDAALMAYDLFNEPLYFDKPNREKSDVYAVTRRWKRLCHLNAPRQLVTIGLAGIRETHRWDPATINVDFVSFHPYEHEPEQVRNEITWYNRFVKKPWIIGETAIPADGDSVHYDEQKLFAEKTMTQARNCGAWGYSWWQYKDVRWKAYHSSYMGVVNLKGETRLPKDSLVVYGTIKPVAEVFEKFDPAAPKGECLCLSNYYNYSGRHEFRIKGKLIDAENKPVEGGVVLAWNESWVRLYHTITKADGSFELMSDFPFYHWIASANAYSMIRGDLSPDSAKKDADGIPTTEFKTLTIKKLSFGN